LEVLREKPSKINVNYLMRFPEFREFLNKGKEKTTEDDKSTQGISETETPIETIDRAYQFIKDQLAKEILERIMQKPPEFFEKLIMSTDSDFVTPKNTNLDSENVTLFV